MKQKRFSLFAAVMLLCVPGPLWAQPGVSDDATAKSRLHFERGVQSYKDGSLNSALAEFTRAYELTHDYRLLYNVAQVQSERHEYVRAIEILTEYLKQGSGALPKERLAEVDTQMARLRLRIGELWVSANSPGAEVWIDNHMVSKLPLGSPILVNAGPCVVRITSPGYKPVTKELDIAGGDRPRLELTLEPEGQAPTQVKVARNDTWLWVSLTATGLLAAGSVVAGVLAKKENQTLDDRINTFPSNPASIDDARKTVRTDAIICDALAGGAALGALASIYFALNPKYKSAPRSGAASQPASARVVPGPTGFFVQGSF